MSRNTRGSKEYSRLQEYQNENKRLKREIASLRKQLARIDLDRHGYVKGILEEHYASEGEERNAEKTLNKMKERWKCNECHNGYLEINIYTKVGNPWYFRKCNSCPHRTPSQQYFPDQVEGIMKLPIK